MSRRGRFDFDDGGTYCGDWHEGKAHGYGVCRGPGRQGEYSGGWALGFEALGVYTSPGGSAYAGQWGRGSWQGLGAEHQAAGGGDTDGDDGGGGGSYAGEWSQGVRGPLGVQEGPDGSRYEGSWSGGAPDGHGTETYSDGGTYHGSWVAGQRQGSGLRHSAPYCQAALRGSPRRGAPAPGPAHLGNGALPHAPRPPTPPAPAGFVLSGRGGARGDSSRAKAAGGKAEKLLAFFLGRLGRSESRASLGSKRSSLRSEAASSTVAESAPGGREGEPQRWEEDGSAPGGREGEPQRREPGNSAPGGREEELRRRWQDNSAAAGREEELRRQDNSAPGGREEEEDGQRPHPAATETYGGEWQADRRSGHGVGSRSDGLTYEGAWLADRPHGYGRTTFPLGDRGRAPGQRRGWEEEEEGKYRAGALLPPPRLPMRRARLRRKVERSVRAARRALGVARETEEAARARTIEAGMKSEAAFAVAQKAQEASRIARALAKELSPIIGQTALHKLSADSEEDDKLQLLGLSRLSDRGTPEIHGNGTAPSDGATPEASPPSRTRTPRSGRRGGETEPRGADLSDGEVWCEDWAEEEEGRRGSAHGTHGAASPPLEAARRDGAPERDADCRPAPSYGGREQAQGKTGHQSHPETETTASAGPEQAEEEFEAGLADHQPSTNPLLVAVVIFANVSVAYVLSLFLA
uniref:junctophilin-4-like n=1 Tax=Pristiophorus japonicus TaxID=55135 RepID=UPI00398E3D81